MSKYKIGDVLVSLRFPQFIYRVVYVKFNSQFGDYYIAAAGTGGWGSYQSTVEKEYRHATSLELFLLGYDEKAT